MSDKGKAIHAAVSVWIKNSFEWSALDDKSKRGLQMAIDIIGTSVEFVLDNKGKAITPAALSVYLLQKHTKLLQLGASEQMACVNAVVELTFSGGQALSTFAIGGAATVTSGGLAAPAATAMAFLTAVTVLANCHAVWDKCGPLVKAFIQDLERAARLQRLLEQNRQLYQFEAASSRARTA